MKQFLSLFSFHCFQEYFKDPIRNTDKKLIRNTRLILALAIPTGVPITAENKQRETPLLLPDKTSKILPA